MAQTEHRHSIFSSSRRASKAAATEVSAPPKLEALIELFCSRANNVVLTNMLNIGGAENVIAHFEMFGFDKQNLALYLKHAKPMKHGITNDQLIKSMLESYARQQPIPTNHRIPLMRGF